MAITKSITYAVSVSKHNGVPQTDKLFYGKVEREDLTGHTSYIITSRSNATMRVDADAIDCLIAALIQARGAIDPVSGEVA